MIGNNLHKNFKIFVDFDGTISPVDVGEEIFLKFGDKIEAQNIIERWINKEINSYTSWNLLCETIKNFNQTDFDDFIDSIKLEPSFKNLINFCSENNFDLCILSDGLDYYIKRILTNENIFDIPVFSNQILIDNENKLRPIFPFTDEECKRCGNCKRNHILNFSDDSDYTVYIGDGNSDTCPAQHCDFIFAKKSLLKFCEINRISYYPFKNFNEVVTILNELKNRKRLKKRHQAELKRREVYIQG
ncbi:MAG: MtnX-like HAD-IB family phosphatase [Ignavibacteriales bacterium]|nr:MtnX-like HAD-IB family phosphatase [Ignavibacteriales bacterium]